MSAIESQTINSSGYGATNLSTKDAFITPLESTGCWDQHKQSEVTPLIGTVFEEVNLADVLRSPDCNPKIRDHAILVSCRGFWCFESRRSSASLTMEVLVYAVLTTLRVRRGAFPRPSVVWTALCPRNRGIIPVYILYTFNPQNFKIY